MIRLILRLLGIHDFETCKSCEVLRQQLLIANEEKKELTNTLLSLLQPKLVEQSPTELQPIIPRGGSFMRRRAALEERDRAEARARQSRFAVQTPVSEEVARLEKELGVVEEHAG